MRESDILALVSQSSEFENIMLREEEMPELEKLEKDCCQIPIKGGKENKHGKVNILLQSYLSHAIIDSFSLVSDSAYIAQNAPRILRQ
jgi:activating signal cointegrator complex subunit 3